MKQYLLLFFILTITFYFSSCGKLEDLFNDPIADFTVNRSAISPGEFIQFIDSTTNNPTSWKWDFGDGHTSTEQNPRHSYSETGSYSVSLKASNKSGTDDEYRADYIKVFNFGSVADIDGNTYKTTRIGNQVWMAENLKTTKYFDGSAIPNHSYSWYNDDQSTYGDIYGTYYTYYAIESDSICPTGWHVSSEADWEELIDYLKADDLYNKELSVLKSTGRWGHWALEYGGMDEFGFSALPGGVKDDDGYHDGESIGGFWWLSGGLALMLGPNNHEFRGLNSSTGCSVRCVKD